MAMHTISHRWSQRVLWQGEAESIKDAVIAAVKSEADLSWANLSRANLSRANLSRADLSRADLSWADLSEANLSGANLSWADLSRANLSGANLSWADLSRANLSGANLSWANLLWANLSGANLSWANLLGALYVTLPTGETWIDYLTVTVPALLTAGGKSLESFGPSFDCHNWQNCPMAHAFDVHRVEDVPVLLRPRAEQFIQFFDARLIPWPLPTREQLEADQAKARAEYEAERTKGGVS